MKKKWFFNLYSQQPLKEKGASSNDEEDEDVKSVLKQKMDKLSMEIGYFGKIILTVIFISILNRLEKKRKFTKNSYQ